MNDTIKVTAPTDDRTEAQAARAAPVSLPAGSYDSAELQKALDEAAKPKNDDKRDEMVATAVDNLNEMGTDHGSLDLQPGYKRVAVVDEHSGVTENRVVFDVAAAVEVSPSPAISNPAPDAGADTTKG